MGHGLHSYSYVSLLQSMAGNDGDISWDASWYEATQLDMIVGCVRKFQMGILFSSQLIYENVIKLYDLLVYLEGIHEIVLLEPIEPMNHPLHGNSLRFLNCQVRLIVSRVILLWFGHGFPLKIKSGFVSWTRGRPTTRCYWR